MKDSKVAGALFDFCGFLTTRPGTLKVGSSHNVPPMIEALEEWAGTRDFDMSDADVMDWHAPTTPPTGDETS